MLLHRKEAGFNNNLTPIKSRIFRYLLIGVIFSFVIFTLYHQWKDLPSDFFSKIDLHLLILSITLLIPAILFDSFRWTIVLKMMNSPISWLLASKIWFQSQSGRFFPGGVWNYVARFYMSRKNLDKNIIITSMFIETIIRILSELLIFLFSLPFFINLPYKVYFVSICIIIIFIFGILLSKPSVISLASRIKIIRKKFPDLDQIEKKPLKVGHTLLLLSYNVITGLLILYAFYIFVKSFVPMNWQQFPIIIGSLSGSIALSFIIPLVPNGLGIREGLLMYLLHQIMPLSIASLIAISTRIWLTTGELILIFLAFICFPTKNNP